MKSDIESYYIGNFVYYARITYTCRWRYLYLDKNVDIDYRASGLFNNDDIFILANVVLQMNRGTIRCYYGVTGSRSKRTHPPASTVKLAPTSACWPQDNSLLQLAHLRQFWCQSFPSDLFLSPDELRVALVGCRIYTEWLANELLDTMGRYITIDF